MVQFRRATIIGERTLLKCAALKCINVNMGLGTLLLCRRGWHFLRAAALSKRVCNFRADNEGGLVTEIKMRFNIGCGKSSAVLPSSLLPGLQSKMLRVGRVLCPLPALI